MSRSVKRILAQAQAQACGLEGSVRPWFVSEVERAQDLIVFVSPVWRFWGSRVGLVDDAMVNVEGWRRRGQAGPPAWKGLAHSLAVWITTLDFGFESWLLTAYKRTVFNMWRLRSCVLYALQSIPSCVSLSSWKPKKGWLSSLCLLTPVDPRDRATPPRAHHHVIEGKWKPVMSMRARGIRFTLQNLELKMHCPQSFCPRSNLYFDVSHSIRQYTERSRKNEHTVFNSNFQVWSEQRATLNNPSCTWKVEVTQSESCCINYYIRPGLVGHMFPL